MKKIVRTLMSLALALGLWASPTIVQAAPLGDAIVTLTGSPLSVATQSVPCPTTALTGQAQTITCSTGVWQVIDPTGTGAGYHVNISGANFINGPRTIAINNLAIRLTNGNISTVAGNTAPGSSLASFTSLSGSAQSLLSAAADSGMGTYDFAPEFQLTIPANAYAGTYNAVLTVTVVAGP